jgi:hypothetical protein
MQIETISWPVEISTIFPFSAELNTKPSITNYFRLLTSNQLALPLD